MTEACIERDRVRLLCLRSCQTRRARRRGISKHRASSGWRMTAWLRVTYDPNCCNGAVVLDAPRARMAVRRFQGDSKEVSPAEKTRGGRRPPRYVRGSPVTRLGIADALRAVQIDDSVLEHAAL